MAGDPSENPVEGAAPQEQSKSAKRRARKKAATAAGDGDAAVDAAADGVAALDVGAKDAEDDADGDAADKKKKKRNRKKKGPGMPALDNSLLRGLGDWKATPGKQTWPPSKPINELFPPGSQTYPEGEIVPYHDGHHQAYRVSDKEVAEREKAMYTEDYQNVRRAAEVHRQVRRYVQSFVRPGIPMIELVQRLEAKTLELVKKEGMSLETGWGFPTGCSLNHVAAHYTPNYGDKTVRFRLLDK